MSAAASGQVGRPLPVGERDLELLDAARGRPIKAHVWYPAEAGAPRERPDLPFVLPPTLGDVPMAGGGSPLVLLSHGTGGNRFGLAWLGIGLARRGYVACAVDHWGNTFDNKAERMFVRFWERPLDLSFALTALLGHPEFGPRIDGGRVGAAGFSLGGYTALALAGAVVDLAVLRRDAFAWKHRRQMRLPEMDMLALIRKHGREFADYRPDALKDGRFKAFAAMAPALGLGFAVPGQCARVDAPTLIIGAGGDAIAPPTTNAARYHALIPRSIYHELPRNVRHYVFLNVANEELRKSGGPYFRDGRGVDRAAIHDSVASMVCSFFDGTPVGAGRGISG